MEIKGNENGFVFSKRIEFTAAGGSTEFVELREFNTQENIQFQRAVGGKLVGDKVEDVNWRDALAKAEEFFPGCVVSSSFTYDGEPASGRQVYELLKKNAALMLDIIGEWIGTGDSDSPFRLVSGRKRS